MQRAASDFFCHFRQLNTHLRLHSCFTGVQVTPKNRKYRISEFTKNYIHFFSANQIKSYLNHCQPHVTLSQKGYIYRKNKEKERQEFSKPWVSQKDSLKCDGFIVCYVCGLFIIWT